ncbi:hypothetical protein UMM65_10445 [Aureibaculum sp. 2210JD6-5]|uniref:hypothetical protein n=1 Tax=Aureibaculum sp. 2210JD6-5 TaxID=3103957 RepID=UPI002AAD947F|nr:hypothetical protein [Aureibaculum sp. 2210JD6-5]MDY7395662.1 hypothetical protein [Aureibaculum sp. 2210JD6-5]
MENVVKIIVLIVLFAVGNLSAQTRKTEEESKPKVVNEVEEANKSVKQASNATKETVQTTKETVSDLKETVGMIFPKKNKPKKAKEIVSIQISQIEYGDENLDALYKAISKAKGVKDLSKTFANNQAAITATYKKTADDLWQSVPETIRSSFKIKSITENSILVSLKEQ